MGKSGDVRTDFGRNFLVSRRFFAKAANLKISLTNPPIFGGFVIGEASGDGRPMIGRHFEDFFIKRSAESRPIIGHQSADDRQTVGRWHFIKESSADRRRISAVIRPIIARLSANHKLWFVLNCLQCMYPHYLWNYIMHSFLFIYCGNHSICPRV